MSKSRIILITLTVLAILAVPLNVATAQAGVFYCSATRTSGGIGTYYDPWACSNDTQLNAVTDSICRVGGGTLFRIHSGAYQIFYIRWTGNICEVTAGPRYPGYPPNTGVDLPAPLLYGGIVAVGLALVTIGLLIRRKQRAV